MADLLFPTNPLFDVERPFRPTIKAGKPKYGGNVTAAFFQHEVNIPAPPKTVIENGYIRFKAQVEGKWELVEEAKSVAGLTADAKVNVLERTASAQVGGRVNLTETIEASVKAKVSAASLECLFEAFGDPKKFGLALLRYLEVVVGKNFKIDSRYLKSVGVGLAWDTDFCFFSVLVPVTVPLSTPDHPMGLGGRLTANVILKFGPGKQLWTILFQKAGRRKVFRWLATAIRDMARKLPSVVAKEAVAAAAEAQAIETALVTGVVEAPAVVSAFEAFCMWVGVSSIAIPVAVTMAEFSVALCRSAAARGVREGDLNLYAQTYVRAVYGRETGFLGLPHSMTVKNAALDRADADLDRHGPAFLQKYLEDRWNDGKPPAGDREINTLAERVWLAWNGQFNR